MMLDSENACRQYLEQQGPRTIARQLRHDQELCQAGKLPSMLALYSPRPHSDLGEQIATELCPSSSGLPRSIQALQYSGIVQGIKAYLHQMTPISRHGPLPAISTPKASQPSSEEFRATLKVLQYLIENRESIDDDTSLRHVISAINNDLETLKNEATTGYSVTKEAESYRCLLSSSMERAPRRKCYICRFLLLSSHPQYPSLCRPCGDFNLASCEISAPKDLCLNGKTALVTGGRLNLGYHTALRLLRCGARVIASSRYPRDAEARYLAEKDSSQWCQSLRIVGADFRTASDVFDLIALAKDCLRGWDQDGEAKLDILVNNAAQTLTDPLDTERDAVKKERQLRISGASSSKALLLDSSYDPRIRGDLQASLLLESDNPLLITSGVEADSEKSTPGHEPANDPNSRTVALSTVPPDSEKSSWVQSISQIPYEDIISAHSVNTFVPLILVRELLPLMGSANHTRPNPSFNAPSKPLAYIVNVSSREGIFEGRPNSSAKHGHHVHTNLTKAALNMLTETEASPAWRNRKVAMNTVDPGYMSAAPEIMKQWRKKGQPGCPIGWEDGVGRVLWPIAVGERGQPVWGRFLKHFGTVEVEVGVGRG